jgi:hypothetical protein
MMMRRTLKAMVVGLTVPCLLYAEAPTTLSGPPSTEGQNSQELGAMSAPATLSAATCRALGCDIPLTDTIATATTRGCFTFSVPDVSGGTRVHISVIEGTPSQTNFQPSWRLLTAQGNPASNCGSFNTNANRDCGPLPASGNPYRLEVEDHQRNATGTYRVHLQRLTTGTVCENTPLTCDTPVTRNIDNPVDSDLVSFSVPNVAGGTWVHIRLREGPTLGTPSWRLLTGAGAPAGAPAPGAPGSCGLFAATRQRDCGPLPASGNPYRIEVQDRARNQTGSYSVYLQPLTTGTTCDNTPVGCSVLTRSIDSPLDSDLLSFSVTNGATVHISRLDGSPSGPKFDPVWRLVTRTGTPVQVSGCGVFRHTEESTCGPLPSSGNPYRLEVQEFQGDDTGTYRVRVCPQ